MSSTHFLSFLREKVAERIPKASKAGFKEMLIHNWYLGFTAFGGPAVHFQIFHKHFVEKYEWIDEQMFQEFFAICQSLPGPGSTKMLFGINVIRSGFTSGCLSFLIWSLPGALGMYGLAVGIQRIDDTLPAPVYALITGLNAATVGIIALAAVQLSQKAIKDTLTRILVFAGGTAGMLHNALWYFPVLMIGGGIATVIWDCRKSIISSLHKRGPKKRSPDEEVGSVGRQSHDEMHDMPGMAGRSRSTSARAPRATALDELRSQDGLEDTNLSPEQEAAEQLSRTVARTLSHRIFSWKFGICIAGCFFLTFAPIMVLRGVLEEAPRGFRLFANMYLAGTIIFGGGPVVIPLLREYIVAEGWLSSRDFLLGLAIIQAFPGPNFNFAVYLGALATTGTSLPSAIGALCGYLGIFLPGLILHTSAIGIWKTMRKHQWVTSLLRGVNASAVGLIYTAVYRLWRIGFVNAKFTSGSSLDGDPWLVVITATSFVGGMWFKMSAPTAILLGGVMGMVWYAVVR